MKTIKKVESNVGKQKFQNLLFIDTSPDDQGWFANNDYPNAATILDASPQLLEAIDQAIQFGLEKLAEAIHQDLTDIWNKVEDK